MTKFPRFLLGFGLGIGLGFTAAAVVAAVNPPAADRAAQLLSLSQPSSAQVIHPPQP